MKVLLMLDFLSPGGIQSLLLDICRNSSTSDVKFVMLITGTGELEQQFRGSGTECVFVKRRRGFDPTLILALRRIIKEREIEIIHCHEVVTAFYSYLASRGLERKVVLSLHGYIKNRKNKLAFKYLMSRLDAIVAVSKAVLDDFKNQFGIDDRGQFHVLYNGIDLKRIDCERRDLRDELGIPKTSLVMGMIGNFINDVRDQMTVVQALPEVLSYYPAAYFIFVGAPSDVYPWCYQQCFEYCEKNGLSRRVLFLGKRHDVGNILRTLNLFVYSSNYDTFGIAVVEAMLTGVPVIVNDLPVFQEITDNGRNALIYGTKNVNDLVTKIRFAFENKTAVTEIAAKAKADARMRFSIETHINNLTKLYTSISG